MRILIAEDDVVTGRNIAESLAPWGYEPTLVHDGQAALELLRAEDAPSLALLDWKMPRLDGIEVCRRIRAEGGRPYTYVVMLTGMTGRRTMLAGLDAGADDFLVKPFDSQELHARLNCGRRIVVLQQQLLEAQHQLYAQATHDALTGLWNRAAILGLLDREISRAERESSCLAVTLIDVDHFKRVNDTHGHLVGDQVLREMARLLGTILRPYDTLGRYGGEEFLVVLSGFDAALAMRLAERLRRQIAEAPWILDHLQIPMTISLGIACWCGNLSPSALLQHADDALYAAKAAGRNQIKLATAGDAVETGHASLSAVSPATS